MKSYNLFLMLIFSKTSINSMKIPCMQIYENIQKHYKLERSETWWKFIGTILNQTILEDRLVIIP